MFSKSNLLRGLGLTVVLVLCYFIPNHFVLFTPHSVVLTRFDALVPLSPEWVWFYVSYYPLLVAAYFLTTGHPAQRVYVRAMALAASIGFFIFLFFPTTIPRELYPWTGPYGRSADLLEYVRRADKSVNCLPSMHVALSFISASAISLVFGWRARAFVWLLFIGIVYSTMATKQHYFVDLVAGFALAVTVFAIEVRREGPTRQSEIETKKPARVQA